MDLSIVIVNYKSQDKLRRLLASLRAADFSGIQSEIIVVENNSGDYLGDLEALAKVIKSPRNLGMGGGNNLGISQSQGEYVAIMNPDTLVKADSLKILYNYIKQHPAVGLVGPKLVYPDGSLQYSCSRFPGFWIPILRRTFLGDYFRQVRDSFMMLDFNHDLISEVDWLMGSCLMFKRDLRFDERYFMYFEDTDLARQVRSRGLKVVYNPEAVVVHDHQRASAELPWYQAIFKSRLAWLHILSWWKYFLKWGLKSKI